MKNQYEHKDVVFFRFGIIACLIVIFVLSWLSGVQLQKLKDKNVYTSDEDRKNLNIAYNLLLTVFATGIFSVLSIIMYNLSMWLGGMHEVRVFFNLLESLFK
jgi:hypothetical protein